MKSLVQSKGGINFLLAKVGILSQPTWPPSPKVGTVPSDTPKKS